MTLGFKQQFPWKGPDGEPEPTHFREKILYGVGRAIWLTPRQIKKYPKLHTMRLDPHNRWKSGRKIEMVYRGAGYKILDHFNKGIPELSECTGVQKIKIWATGYLKDGQPKVYVNMLIDGKRIDDTDRVIINDGFTDKYQFLKWFKKPVELKLIHWTDLRY